MRYVRTLNAALTGLAALFKNMNHDGPGRLESRASPSGSALTVDVDVISTDAKSGGSPPSAAASTICTISRGYISGLLRTAGGFMLALS